MALTKKTNEELLAKLPSLPPVEQARIDMQLHANALKDRDRFDHADDKFLMDDMGVKQRFIRAIEKGANPAERKDIAGKLSRDIFIHQDYLRRPESANTGSHNWHRTWIGVYRNWLKTLGQDQQKPTSVRGMPPAPPPDDDFALDEQLILNQSGGSFSGDSPHIAYEQQRFDPVETIDNPNLAARGFNPPVESLGPIRDDFGNEWNGSTWVSPEGNQFDPNKGYWEDPNTGNRLNDSGQWESPDGAMLFDEASGSWNFKDDPRMSSDEFKDEFAEQDAQALRDNPTTERTQKEIFEEERQKIIEERGQQPQSFEEMVEINQEAERRSTAIYAQEKVAAEFKAGDARLVEQYSNEAKRVAETEATGFIIAALEQAGFQRTPEGWAGDGSEEDFLRIQDEAAARFYEERLLPFEMALGNARNQLLTDIQALGQSRAEGAQIAEQIRLQREMINSVTEGNFFDSLKREPVQLLSDVVRAADQIGKIPLDAFGIPGVSLTFEALGIESPTLGDAIGGAFKALDEYSQHVTRPLAEAFVGPTQGTQWAPSDIIMAVGNMGKTGDRRIDTVIVGFKVATTAVGLIEALHGSGVVSDEVRLLAYEALLDPANAIPGIGFTHMDDLRAIARASGRIAQNAADNALPAARRFVLDEAGSIKFGDVSDDMAKFRRLEELKTEQATLLTRAATEGDKVLKGSELKAVDQEIARLEQELAGFDEEAIKGFSADPSDRLSTAGPRQPRPEIQTGGRRTQRVGDQTVDVDTGELLSADDLKNIAIPERDPTTARRVENLRKQEIAASQQQASDVVRVFPDQASVPADVRRQGNYKIANPNEPVSIGDAIRLVEEEKAKVLRGLRGGNSGTITASFDATLNAARALMQMAPDAKLAARLVKAARNGTARSVLQAELRRVGVANGLGPDIRTYAKQVAERAVATPEQLIENAQKASQLGDDLARASEAARNSIAREAEMVLSEFLTPSTAKNLSPETQELLKYAPSQLTEEQLARIFDELAIVAKPDEIESFFGAVVTSQLTLQGVEAVGRMFMAAVTSPAQISNAAQYVPPMQNSLSNGGGKGGKGKAPPTPPSGAAPIPANIVARPDGYREPDFVTLLKNLRSTPLYSYTDNARKFLKNLTEGSRFEKRLYSWGWTRTHDSALLLSIEHSKMQASHHNLLALTAELARHDFSSASIKMGRAGKIKLASGQLVNLSDLINDIGAHTLTLSEEAVVLKYREILDHYDDWMRQQWGATDDTFLQMLGLEKGQVLPRPIDATKTRPTLRRPFYGERAKGKTPATVPYENDPALVIYRALESRMKWMEEQWAENAVAQLEDVSKGVDSQLKMLSQKIEELQANLADMYRTRGLPKPPPDIETRINRMEAALDGATKSRTEILEVVKIGPQGDPNRALQAFHEINNTLRQLTATADLSYLGVQGAVGLFHDPLSFMKSLGWSATHMTGQDASRSKWLYTHAKTINIGLEHGLFFSNSTNLGEFASPFLINTLEGGIRKVSGGKFGSPFDFFNSMFSEFGNTYRIKQLDLILQAAEAQRGLGAADNYGYSTKELDDLISTINKMTGVGANKATLAEQVLTFAPRFFRSQIGLLADALTKSGTASGSLPFAHLVPGLKTSTTALTAGDLARQTLLEFISGAVTMTVLLNYWLGEDTDLTDWLNPTKTLADGTKTVNSNFMRIRWHGKDYSILGSWDTLLRLMHTAVREGPINAGEDFLRFKASPIIRMLWENDLKDLVESMRSDWDWTPGAHDFLKYGKNMLKFAGDVATPMSISSLIDDGLGEGPWYVKGIGGAATLIGGKSAPVTLYEKYGKELNTTTKAIAVGLRAQHPDWTDEEIKRQALVQAKREKNVVDAHMAYIREAASQGKTWEIEQVKRQDEAFGPHVQAQQDRDKTIFDTWAGGQSEKHAANKNRMAELTRELAELFDQSAINKINGDMDAARARIDAINAQQKANYQSGSSTSGIFSDLDKLETEIARLRIAQNAARRATIDNPKLGQAQTRELEAQIQRLEDQRSALFAKVPPKGSTSSNPLQSEESNLYAFLKAKSEEKNALYDAADPEIQARLDEQTILRADIKAWEAEIREWISEGSAAGNFLSGKLNAIDVIFESSAINSTTRESEMYAYRKELFAKHQDAEGRIPGDAWGLINLELDNYRNNLGPADTELYDFLFNSDRNKTEMEIAYSKALTAVSQAEGEFFGVDVRLSKPERSLIGAALYATGEANVDKSFLHDDFMSSEAGQFFLKATDAQKLIDQAVANVHAEMPDNASKILANIVSSSGASTFSVLDEFQKLVQNQARRDGVPYREYGETLKDVTQGSIYREMGQPLPPELQPEVVAQQAADSKAAYNAAVSGQQAGTLQTANTKPSPDYAPVPSETYPTGGTHKSTSPLAKSVLDHWTDIVHETFFGKVTDQRTGSTTSFLYGDLAPTRPELYQYMFDRRLDSRESVIAHATELLRANVNNPQLKLLVMGDPYVRSAFIADPDISKAPAARNFVIALDKVLRALDGEILISPEDAVTGFRQVTADRYFTTYDAERIPAVAKLDQQIEGFTNDARVAALTHEVAVIALDISDVFNMAKAGMIPQSEITARVQALENRRIDLLTEKQRLMTENTQRIQELQAHRAYLLEQPLPPGKEVFTYLFEAEADTREEIANELNQLYVSHSEDPRVKNLLDVATGKGAPGPELQAWINERHGQLVSVNQKLSELGQPVLDDAALKEQVQKELRDVLAFRDGFNSKEIGVARHIVAGSALLSVLGGAAAVSSEQNVSLPRTAVPSSTSSPSSPSSGGFQGGGGTPWSSGGSTSFPSGSGGSSGGSSRSSFGGGSGGGSGGGTRTPMPMPGGQQQPAAEPVSPMPDITFGAQTWEQFRNTTRMIFGSARLADVFERAFVAGRAVSDSAALRQARFLWKLVPIEGAKTFDAWLSAMRQIYTGKASFGSGNRATNRRPMPEIRTKRPL